MIGGIFNNSNKTIIPTINAIVIYYLIVIINTIKINGIYYSIIIIPNININIL